MFLERRERRQLLGERRRGARKPGKSSQLVDGVSGVAVEGRHYAVWTLHDGKVVRMRVFRERCAAGLRS
jgi:hypothetical protein